MPFFRHDMQQYGALQGFHHFEILAEYGDVVTINGPQVTKAEILKHHAAMESRFHGLFDLREKPLRWVTKQGHMIPGS